MRALCFWCLCEAEMNGAGAPAGPRFSGDVLLVDCPRHRSTPGRLRAFGLELRATDSEARRPARVAGKGEHAAALG